MSQVAKVDGFGHLYASNITLVSLRAEDLADPELALECLIEYLRQNAEIQ